MPPVAHTGEKMVSEPTTCLGCPFDYRFKVLGYGLTPAFVHALNCWTGVLHTANAVFVLIVWIATQPDPAIPALGLEETVGPYLPALCFNQSAVSEGGPPPFSVVPETAADPKTYLLMIILLFFLLSAGFQLFDGMYDREAYYSRLINNDVNALRYIEYSMSASLMMIGIACSLFVFDLYTHVLVFTCTMLCMMLGLVSDSLRFLACTMTKLLEEQHNETSEPQRPSRAGKAMDRKLPHRHHMSRGGSGGGAMGVSVVELPEDDDSMVDLISHGHNAVDLIGHGHNAVALRRHDGSVFGDGDANSAGKDGKDGKDGKSHIETLHQCILDTEKLKWLTHCLSWVAIAMPYICFMISYFRSVLRLWWVCGEVDVDVESVPGEVHAVVSTQVTLFMLFGLVQVMQFTREKAVTDAEVGIATEFRFIMLSIISKTLLGWLVVANAFFL